MSNEGEQRARNGGLPVIRYTEGIMWSKVFNSGATAYTYLTAPFQEMTGFH